MIKDFIQKYKEWKSWKRSESATDWHFNPRGSFHLVYRDGNAGVWINGLKSNADYLISLDEEDLEYFYKRYSKKMTEEMESEIAKIKERYINETEHKDNL